MVGALFNSFTYFSVQKCYPALRKLSFEELDAYYALMDVGEN
jgi:hypothetical protein